MNFIKKLSEIRLTDLAQVGGKNANLGEMISQLTAHGIRVPLGFAVTAQAYWHFLEYNKLTDPIKKELAQLHDLHDMQKLQTVGAAIRNLISRAVVPQDLAQEMIAGYQELCRLYKTTNLAVAVRSSATAEDLPNASFAGQQESFLNVMGEQALLQAYVDCLASLFTDRAIAYRADKGFDHFNVGLSVGIQKMVRSDLACSGVIFTLDTESGFKDVVTITASYGLGESIVKGLVIPDEYCMHKPTFEQGFRSIIKKELGTKQTKMVVSTDVQKVKTVPVTDLEQKVFCLNDEQIVELSRFALTIEKYYSDRKGSWAPMDIEWAQDGTDNLLYIIQARPETIHGNEKKNASITQYRLQGVSPKDLSTRTLLTGQSIGQKIAAGKIRLISTVAQLCTIKAGDILVTQMTDPDWVPAMKKAAAIVTDRGGRTCHAAIVSRELGIPAIVGTHTATQLLKDGQEITIDCSQGMTGYVYQGCMPIKTTQISYATLPKSPVDLLLNIAEPNRAFELSTLPVAGVGLARTEFIIANTIKIHPMALVEPAKVTDPAVTKKINEITAAYSDKKQFFVDTLAQGIGMIAAGFYPRQVVVRLSDFKSNEYRNLIGGSFFEPHEENPMLGFRGAFRYCHPLYVKAFELECAAMLKVREQFGLKNVRIMVPFVRTVKLAHEVLKKMACQSLERGRDDLQIIMMCEVPSNIILIEEFSRIFDGFSIGSNDLTQLTLGVDRDSALLAGLFDERDPAVMSMFAMAIKGARHNKKYVSICGQAPSDYPEVAQELIRQGINALSLNADAIIPFLLMQKE